MTAPGSAVIRALAILVTESHAEATPDALDHWRSTALQARGEYDRLRARCEALERALRFIADWKPEATSAAMEAVRDRAARALLASREGTSDGAV